MQDSKDMLERHPEVVRAVRSARIIGLFLCLAWPLVLMAIITVGGIAPGQLRAEGWVQQVGYTFTGLSLVAAGYVTWRTGVLMKEFRALAPSDRARVAFRSSLGFSILFLLSSVYGLVYWRMVGRNAFQHVLLFVVLSPAMFFIFMPRLEHWMNALQEDE